MERREDSVDRAKIVSRVSPYSEQVRKLPKRVMRANFAFKSAWEEPFRVHTLDCVWCDISVHEAALG
jgi:hypothetical protein